MYNIIKKLCEKNNTNINSLERTLDFSRGSLSKIDNSSPSAAKVKKIADYFNVSIDYLMNGEDSEYSYGEQQIINTYRKLDPASKQTVEDFVKMQLKAMTIRNKKA